MAEIRHGTRSGYNACVKRPEGSCEACREAARVYEQDRLARERAEGAASLAEAMDALPDMVEFDELVEVRRTLKMTDALLYRAKSPRDSAPLIQRRMELLSRVAELEKAAAVERGEGKRVTPVDEIARRRAERLSRAAG